MTIQKYTEKSKKEVLIGISVGADLVLRLLSKYMLTRIDAAIVLDPNVNSSTLFLSNDKLYFMKIKHRKCFKLRLVRKQELKTWQSVVVNNTVNNIII